MLDERHLLLLAEMGIDVYWPRVAAASSSMPVQPDARADAVREAMPAAPEPPTSLSRGEPAVAVLLLAEPSSRGGGLLLADITRALAFARVESALAGTADESALSAAAALVVFGDAHARAVGALLPAQRQRELGWIVTGTPALLVGDAQAKRALWSELKRVLRPPARG